VSDTAIGQGVVPRALLPVYLGTRPLSLYNVSRQCRRLPQVRFLPDRYTEKALISNSGVPAVTESYRQKELHSVGSILGISIHCELGPPTSFILKHPRLNLPRLHSNNWLHVIGRKFPLGWYYIFSVPSAFLTGSPGSRLIRVRHKHGRSSFSTRKTPPTPARS
jgi:hypothetical protein